MLRKLEQRPWIADHSKFSPSLLTRSILTAMAVIPNFSVSCRRLTPGPGYLEALCADNVRPRYPRKFPPLRTLYSAQTDFVTSAIKRFTETGIETEDGQHQELDIVFCATGRSLGDLLSSPPDRSL